MKLCVNAVVESPTGFKATGFARNVDAFADDGECDVVLSNDMLNYVHFSDAERFITHLAKKVRHEGTIVLGAKCPIEICKMLLRGDFNFTEFNRIIYGDTDGQPLEGTITINAVVNILQQNGFKIMKKRLEGYDFTVEAVRL